MTATLTPEVTKAATVEVGDVFYCSWGYDQTNVDYYVVVGVSVTGKTAKLRQVGTKLDGGGRGLVPVSDRFVDDGAGWCQACRQRTNRRGNGAYVHTSTSSSRCIDSEGRYTGTTLKLPPPTIYTRRVQTYGGDVVFNRNSYSNLYRWDGSPKYDTRAAGEPGH